MVGVAGEVLGGKLPVAWHHPLVHPAEDLDSALAPVEEGVQIPSHLTKVFLQGRCIRVEGGEHQPLIALQLGHGNETPLGGVQLVVVGFLQAWHGNELPVGAVGPAMVGADERGGVAGVSTANPVATVAAYIEESVDSAVLSARHQHRVFTHVGGEEVARLRDLGLMAQVKPAAGENLLQLLLVDVLFDEDAPAE